MPVKHVSDHAASQRVSYADLPTTLKYSATSALQLLLFCNLFHVLWQYLCVYYETLITERLCVSYEMLIMHGPCHISLWLGNSITVFIVANTSIGLAMFGMANGQRARRIIAHMSS